MPINLKYYGNYVEITEIEKTPKKVRVSAPRKKSNVHREPRFDSLRRTKGICMRRLLSALKEFGSPLMLTLTFEGSASDLAFATQALSKFQRRLRIKYPLAQSLFIPELSPRYRIHFHGLLFNVPQELGDKRVGRRTVERGLERSTRELATLWGAGFVDCQQTDGNERLAYYIAKYITKSVGGAFFAPVRLVRVSNGFPKEIVVRDDYIGSKVIQELGNRMPVSDWTGYNDFLGKIRKRRYTRS